MGAWGHGLFSNDTSRDVRALYLETLRSTSSNEIATARIKAAWPAAFDDPSDEGSIDILAAVAASQMECGYLDRHVRELTLVSLASAAALAQWVDTPDFKRRRAVLQRFEDALRALNIDEQRPRIKKKRAPYSEQVIWSPGDCLFYSPLVAPATILVVFHLLEGPSGVTAPVVGLLAQRGFTEEQATDADLSSIPFVSEDPHTMALLKRKGLIKSFELHQTLRHRAPINQIVTLGKRRVISEQERAGLCATQATWKEFEAYLSSSAA